MTSQKQVDEMRAWRAMHDAAAEGKLDLLDFYVQVAGLDVNAREPYEGYTPLMTAVFKDNLPATSKLIELKADLEAVSPFGFNALYLSSVLPPVKLALVKLLLDARASVNPQFKEGERLFGTSPLEWATAQSNVQLAKLFLEAKADPNGPTKMGPPKLYMLCRYQPNLDMINLLLYYGADINKASATGLTPLIEAAIDCRVELVKLLLARKADVHLRCPAFGSALDIVAEPQPPFLQESEKRRETRNLLQFATLTTPAPAAPPAPWPEALLNPQQADHAGSASASAAAKSEESKSMQRSYMAALLATSNSELVKMHRG